MEVSPLNARLPQALARWGEPDGDTRLVALVEAHGIRDLPFAPERSRIAALVRTVCHQLVSMAAGRAIHQRVVAAIGEPVDASAILATEQQSLRDAGLSWTKVRCLHDLAERSLDGRLPLDDLDAHHDATVSRMLTDVHGLGPWSAKMILLFDLHRPDVFAPEDLGIRHAAARLHGVPLEDAVDLMERQRPAWAPYNSLAALALWHGHEALKEGWRPGGHDPDV